MVALNPNAFIITRKRKKYKFALFANSPLCFEVSEFLHTVSSQVRLQPPCVLELGAGTGLFSVELASANPQKTFLACDVKADRLQKGAAMAEANKLTNIRFLRAHANQLEEILAPESVQAIWLTFPDPFPKARHAKHRLTHPGSLKLYKNLLKRNGWLYFKTDSHLLFDWSLEQLVANNWKLRELSYDLHGTKLNDEYKITTTFEKKFLDEGKSVCFVSAQPPNTHAANHQSSRRP